MTPSTGTLRASWLITWPPTPGRPARNCRPWGLSPRKLCASVGCFAGPPGAVGSRSSVVIYSRFMNIDLLRMSILTSLAAGPQHGYGVLRDVESITGGRVTPAVGSLYRVLETLARDGYLVEARTEVIDGRFRRYYQLTDLGRSALLEAADTMINVAKVARTRTSPERALRSARGAS